MTRKSHNNSPISLFAFQDIITSVTGVFLLMTLLMAVELASRETMQQSAVSAEEIERLTVSVEELEAEVSQLRGNLASRTDDNVAISEFTQSSADTAVQAIREELRVNNLDPFLRPGDGAPTRTACATCKKCVWPLKRRLSNSRDHIGCFITPSMSGAGRYFWLSCLMTRY